MKPNRSAIPASKVPCATSASRSTTRLKSPKSSMSDVPGQSCRALPPALQGKECHKPTSKSQYMRPPLQPAAAARGCHLE